MIEEIHCPICRGPAMQQAFYDDPWGLVDSWTICDPCGFLDGFSYGQTHMKVGGREFAYSYATPKKDQIRQRKQFKRAVRKARRSHQRKLKRSVSA